MVAMVSIIFLDSALLRLGYGCTVALRAPFRASLPTQWHNFLTLPFSFIF